jgi:dTDP-4-amino-4,6-dideoxygalactose transaminase
LYRREAPSPPDLPVTERIADRGLQIPLFPEMTDHQAHRVCDALLEAVKAPDGEGAAPSAALRTH